MQCWHMLMSGCSGLMELCLDMNENASIPPELRFNIRPPPRHEPPLFVDPNITPDQANGLVAEYREAVSLGRIPPLDLHVVRGQIEQRLAAQGTEGLDALQARTPHPILRADQTLPEDMRLVNDSEPPGYLTREQEDELLHRLDTKYGVDQYGLPLARHHPHGDGKGGLPDEDRNFAELTPREQERLTELLNPHSQHNWLKAHGKNTIPEAEVGDGDSVASHEGAPAKPRKRGGGKGTLAKQVGDRALERAREGFSPSAASAGFADDDELSMLDDGPSSSRKRGKNPDTTYRVKGGKGGGEKGKRKRTSGEGDGGSVSGSSKKARTETATDT